MYYDGESSWAKDLTRWTWAEDDILVCLRLHKYDRTFIFSDLYEPHPNIWNAIAQHKIFSKRQKTAARIEERFLELLDESLAYFNLGEHHQALQKKPAHYSQFTYFLMMCRLIIEGKI
ncbi:hypothetical protein KQX54_000821 [Cotesia glomerata]|uniref:Uncharacterized protein n=1 Tax=Cotesia glomerata TaxID=32391 RepID=A0AAV7HSP9_COTGL|nr:hypothetical protein KQX54_000821 [Cotesia glomerata]